MARWRPIFQHARAVLQEFQRVGAALPQTTPGVPADTDFSDVFDGMVVVDTTNSRLYVRTLGVWKYAALV